MLTSRTILCVESTMKRKRVSTKTTERAKVFTSLVCRVKIRNAIRHSCKRDKGGLIMPDDVDDKNG